MRHILKNLHKTFYDSRFYGELIFTWQGFGLGFLFLISLINVGHMIVVMAEPYSALMREREAVFQALPEIIVKNGIISSDTDSPVKITMLEGVEGGPIRILIDTKAAMTDPQEASKIMKENNFLVMVNNNAISILSPADGALDVKQAKNMADTVITHEKWQKISDTIGSLFTPASIFFVFCITVISHTLTAALGGLFLLIVSPLFKMGMAFPAAMRLSAAAKVPVAFVFLIVAPQPVLQLLLWFGFAAFGLFSAKKTRNLYT